MAFETPVVPAVIVGLALRAAEIHLSPIVAMPLELIGATFPPLALFALGALLAETGRGVLKAGPMSPVLALKLLLAPALTRGLAIALSIPDDLRDLYVPGQPRWRTLGFVLRRIQSATKVCLGRGADLNIVVAHLRDRVDPGHAIDVRRMHLPNARCAVSSNLMQAKSAWLAGRRGNV